jgi:hypothetical protein
MKLQDKSPQQQFEDNTRNDRKITNGINYNEAQQLVTVCSRDLPKVYIKLSFRVLQILNQFVAEF